MRYLLLAMIVLFLFSGCVTVKYNGGTTFVKYIDYPPLDKIVTAYMGDHLVEKGSIYETEVLKVKTPVNGFLYQIPAKEFMPYGSDSNYKYFDSSGVSRSALADKQEALALELKKENPRLCVIDIFSSTSCYDADYELVKRIYENEASFQQTLIYSGRIGNKINISYREFNNNIARPAFNNDIEYDLSVSNQIGYKGALIEVIDADNNNITYRVIRNFR
jgi:hypothetical protein